LGRNDPERICEVEVLKRTLIFVKEYVIMKVSELVSYLNSLAPYTYQESYDNSGLLVGNPSAEVKGVLVALDCVESVLDEALSAVRT
jgi:hypothetical protein